ncbi:Putative 115 kDa protein in type-1 retrotransposable element R1DM [Eumeta japonica]|uniref:115 kDa protein in type-1 retrotransposable element R1DM n=1 Tax=Eumeta variegata TaxID=151549 RepID=A0A4C1YAL0_EUMVA|nr:Putative 115 kDa protein in type-1 retrotransposable element R1DM [Eumeta japonica]
MVSLDIEGAFDNAWWPALETQLRALGCPVNLHDLVRGYLRDREVAVKYAGGECRKGTSKGCIQGSIAGPTFWNLILDSLPENSGNSAHTCRRSRMMWSSCSPDSRFVDRGGGQPRSSSRALLGVRNKLRAYRSVRFVRLGTGDEEARRAKDARRCPAQRRSEGMPGSPYSVPAFRAHPREAAPIDIRVREVAWLYEVKRGKDLGDTFVDRELERPVYFGDLPHPCTCPRSGTRRRDLDPRRWTVSPSSGRAFYRR